MGLKRCLRIIRGIGSVSRSVSRISGLLVAAALVAAAQSDVYKLATAGLRLTPEETVALEQKSDRESHIELLAYWSTRAATTDPALVRAARARHALWMIQNAPDDPLWAASNKIGFIFTAGKWADAQAFDAGKKLWLEQVKNAGQNSKAIRANAANWIQYGDPEAAAALCVESGDMKTLGAVYANAVLGVVALNYGTGDPLVSDAERRQSAFAQRALTELNKATNNELLSNAAFALGKSGGILYADGNLDWDYTAVLAPLLKSARAKGGLATWAISDTLPKRGERPPLVITVDGKTQYKAVKSKIIPRYPERARASHITGTVVVEALIAPTGEVVKVAPVSGPSELVEATVEATYRCKYNPTLVNGKPVFVLTTFESKFDITSAMFPH